MDDEEMFVVPVPRIMVFTVAVVLCFALYGAASAGRDIVTIALKAYGIL
tara:strand:+ start:69 stop:215 length:147 start_codon:yes stop_codon:yes gene_type:complete